MGIILKRILSALLLTCFFLGCSESDRALDRGMDFRKKLLAASGCSFTGEVLADYGDERHSFSLDITADETGQVRFSVLEPKSISGICGTVSSKGGELTFDDKALFFPLLTENQLSPISAPWILLKALRSGYLTAAGMEGDLLRLTVNDSYAQDAMSLDIWMNGDDQPIRGEILWEGRKILTVTVENFRML